VTIKEEVRKQRGKDVRREREIRRTMSGGEGRQPAATRVELCKHGGRIACRYGLVK
jgi:hypothetical protein